MDCSSLFWQYRQRMFCQRRTKSRIAWPASSLLILGLTGCDASRDHVPNASPGAVQSSVGLTLVSRTPGRWARYRVEGKERPIDVYVAHDDRPKPIVVLLHGSSCGPDFTVDADKRLHETSVFQDAIGPSLHRAHFAVIERSGVEPLVFEAGMTQEQKRSAFARAERQCRNAYFFQTATKPIRVTDAVIAIRALKTQPFVRGVILAGHSEGTHVVTGMLRELTNQEVSAAGLFASAGPIPYFCGYAARGPGDRERFARLFDQIRMLQQADDDFIWEGLPARRWKTFWLDSTPIEDVRDSTVPLFVAQGTQDDTTLCADLFAFEAIRQQPKRPLRYVVVDQGNHAFETSDGRWRIAELFDDFLSWALDANRQTSVMVLK
jgi:pimeloyl-ACP methyl ester carboxylesterase